MIMAGNLSVGGDGASEGLLALIIFVAYLRERRAWWCFGVMLVLQLGLSMYLVRNPDSVMNGYLARFGDSLEVENLTSSGIRDGEAIGSRFSGQFGNPVNLAMHAAVGVAAGISILIASRGWGPCKKNAAILAALCLVACGVFLLGVSATRGVIIGLVFGILVHFFGARGPVRFTLLVVGLFCVLIAIYKLDLMPAESLMFGRFAELQNYQVAEEYRLEAMRTSLGAIINSPVLGWGDYELGLNAAKGHLAHIGPYSMAVLYGVPVGMLACMILIWAIMGDLRFANVGVANLDSNFHAICAFASICCWTVVGCIMTNGSSVSAFMYIVLGIAMWPMFYLQSDFPATSRNRIC
jgi:hypothetical protein